MCRGLRLSPRLVALFLFTFTLVGGTVLRYTSYDQALVSGGNTFSVLPIKRGSIREQVGINVETLQISVYADANNQINSTAFLTAAAQGALDGARMKMERVFGTRRPVSRMGSIFRSSPSVIWCARKSG